MYGYNRYQTDIMFITVVLLIVIVQVFQSFRQLGPTKAEATGAFPDLFPRQTASWAHARGREPLTFDKDTVS